MIRTLQRVLLPAIALTLLTLSSASRADDLHDYSSPRAGRANFLTAEFRLLRPGGLDTPRAILVLLPAYNQDSRPLLLDTHWTELARAENLILIGVQFTGDERLDYSRAERGSGQALDEAIRAFSREEGLRDLLLAKIILVGESSGGQYAWSYASYRSTQTLAFVSINSSYFSSPVTAGRQVPGLFVIDPNASPDILQRNAKNFSDNRRAGALWAMTHSGAAALDHIPTRDFLTHFIRQTIQVRLDPVNPLAGMERLSEIDGWAGHLPTGAITPARSVPRGKSTEYSWLPTQPVAESWKSLHLP